MCESSEKPEGGKTIETTYKPLSKKKRKTWRTARQSSEPLDKHELNAQSNGEGVRDSYRKGSAASRAGDSAWGTLSWGGIVPESSPNGSTTSQQRGGSRPSGKRLL